MGSKYIIEKSTNKRNTYEIWKHNRQKGYYNFIKYISFEEIDNFKKEHRKDEIIEKTQTFSTIL